MNVGMLRLHFSQMETAAHPRSLFKPRSLGMIFVTLTSFASLRTGVVKTFRCRTLAISKLTPHTLLTYYEQGTLTKSETLLRLVSLVTARNASTTLQLIPHNWHDEIRAEVSAAPIGDWSTFRIVQAGSYVNMSAEEFDVMQRELVDRYRTGVEALRAYFDSQLNP